MRCDLTDRQTDRHDDYRNPHCACAPRVNKVYVSEPCTVILSKAEKAAFATVQVYSPPVVTDRVCVYCAVSESVSIPSVTVVESLVQVTVVAGLPVEIQVSVN